MRNKIIYKRIIALLLALVLSISLLSGCGKNVIDSDSSLPEITTEEIASIITEQIVNEATQSDSNHENNYFIDEIGYDMENYVYNKIFEEYSLAYDTFEAVITLPDGNEIYGIGYSDFSCYLEPDENEKGYFPAGFLAYDGAVEISEKDKENGVVIENLDYSNKDYGFVLAYDTDDYYEHFVKDGKYVKYGIKDGRIVYTENDFSKEICDTSLGALYSYDDNKYLYDPDVGEYIPLTGLSLFEETDYVELEDKINSILAEQDNNFSSVDIETNVYYAQEAVNSYLLSLQEETFLGCNVEKLIEEVSKLDPMETIRITPDGNVVIDIDDEIPDDPSTLAKWVVGISCGIALIGSVALEVFVPATAPVDGAISGVAIEVFLQVVIENQNINNINWSKVAVAAVTGALLSWACPLGAGKIAQSVASKTGNEVLSKLAGYGFLTLSNSLVSGITGATFTMIDGGDDKEIFDSFLIGATIGACCTVAASALGEIGQASLKALKNSHPENWFVKLTEGASKFIEGHQIHFSEELENILVPKSVYEAAQAGLNEFNQQATLISGSSGGAYNEVKKCSNGNYTEVHETPAFSATGASGTREEANGPAIKMTKEDHHKTASWGNSKEAKEYREAQRKLIESGNYHDAIQMDIDDLRYKFGDKYDKGIDQMIEYAKKIGWW